MMSVIRFSGSGSIGMNCQTNNIGLSKPVIDTTPQDIPQTVSQDKDALVPGWKGLSLKLRQGLNSAGQLYQQLISKVGEAVGVADGEPYWNGLTLGSRT